jgi:hypothetical protein
MATDIEARPIPSLASFPRIAAARKRQAELHNEQADCQRDIASKLREAEAAADGTTAAAKRAARIEAARAGTANADESPEDFSSTLAALYRKLTVLQAAYELQSREVDAEVGKASGQVCAEQLEPYCGIITDLAGHLRTALDIIVEETELHRSIEQAGFSWCPPLRRTHIETLKNHITMWLSEAKNDGFLPQD